MPARSAKVAKVRAEVVDVEVAAAFAWKQKGRVALLADVLQGVEGACLERHRSQAGVGLRPLEHSFREGAPHVDDATVAIEVAVSRARSTRPVAAQSRRRRSRSTVIRGRAESRSCVAATCSA
jgi:hypothetical protein